jgi:hypothetical protein
LRIHHGSSMVIHQVSGDDNGHFKINDPGGYPNKLLVEYWIYSLWGPWSHVLTSILAKKYHHFRMIEHDWTMIKPC